MTRDPGERSRLDRGEFLRSLVALGAGLFGSSLAGSRRQEEAGGGEAAVLPRRPLGSTGEAVTMLGVGGFHVGGCASEAEGRAVVETAYAEGVRFFDNAESYQDGRAERWMGAALSGVRDDVFLMTKTHSPEDRSRESAKRHLEGSLERLGTDRLDLWQLHSVKSVEDVELAFRPGGTFEYLLEQKEAGVVRFVGVTGHMEPAAHRRAIELFDAGQRFDCMQFPINPVDALQKSFQTALVAALVERGVGVLAMKTSAAGRLIADGICTIEECLRFVWTLPVAVAIVGMESPEQVRTNARLARSFRRLEDDEAAALLERIRPRTRLELEWYKNG